MKKNILISVLFIAQFGVLVGLYKLTTMNTKVVSEPDASIVADGNNPTDNSTESQVAIRDGLEPTSKIHVCDLTPKPNNPDFLCYTVEPGDTLWSIAATYLGNGIKWNQLHNGPPRTDEYVLDPITGQNTYVGSSRLDNSATQLFPGMEVGMNINSLPVPADPVVTSE